MKLSRLIYVFTFLIIANIILAQSDYQKVEEFRSRTAQLSQAINNSISTDELDSLKTIVNYLKKLYEDDKELLDKSLYPENYTSAFQKLENDIESRRVGLSQISELQEEVIALKSEIQILNERNADLLSRIKEYQAIGGKDTKSLTELRNLVDDLRKSLKQRDELVRSIVDSLLSDFIKHPMSLNAAEKQNIFDKIETGNLFYNIEKTVRDNMDFLNVTELKPEDLGELKENQVRFYNIWKKMGPRLADVYIERGQRAGEVAYITNLFAQWNQKLDAQIWERVHRALKENNVQVSQFQDGNEFTRILKEYINNRKLEASEKEFDNFEDIVWMRNLKTDWTPILVDNGMLTIEQRNEIQKAVDEWSELYDSETSIYWYIAIVVIIILFLLIFIPKWKKKNKTLAEQ
ncbi:MAG TPA: hypothetical protein ENN33_15605 [Ignavibacteria bacterium]|nr:hypothetical protein [Ignavibacteria bacterium]